MSKAIVGAAEIGIAVAATAWVGGIGGLAVLAEQGGALALYAGATVSLFASGLATEAGAIASAIGSQGGIGVTTRTAAGLRQIVRGEQRIPGNMVYCSTTGSTKRQYNMVIVLATHPSEAIANLYLDGRQVIWQNGSHGNFTFPDGSNFGGTADPGTYIGPNGQHYTFGSEVFCYPHMGTETAGTVVNSDLFANDPAWAPTVNGTPYLGGCTWVYLKLEADSSTFPQFPEIRFTVKGKKDIFDPRTSLTGYSTNWALHVADAITDPLWGLGDNSVNQAQLIAAANVCDEQVQCQSPKVVSGLLQFGSLDESRYCLHWHYDTGTSPGDAIQQMMDAAAGRLSRIGGEWYIWPAYWQGPSFTFDENALLDTLAWNPRRPLSELFNRVTGTYIAPNYPYNVAGDLYDSNGYFAGLTQDNFPYAFQPTNYPMYAVDALHGYGAGVDVYLTQDGGIVLPREIQQPCVLSIAQAQRVAKIFLLRNRQQGTGTFTMSLAAFQMQPTDVMAFNFPALSWVNKSLEVVSLKFKIGKLKGQDVPSVYVELGVQETDISVYDWTLSEELNAYDVPVATGVGVPFIVPPPTAVSVEDDAATASIGTNGALVPRLLISWTPPVDSQVNNGGSIEVQYQFVYPTGSPNSLAVAATSSGGSDTTAWIDAGKFSGQSTYCYVPDIPPTTQVNVQVRAVRTNGGVSAWVAASGGSGAGHYPRPHALTGNQVQGVTANPSIASSFADLPELGTSNAAMDIATLGNACLLGVQLGFASVSSGGAVNGVGMTFSNTTGFAPPSVSISISGDGSGASAGVSWTHISGSGATAVWQPTLTISGGANYTTATATIVISITSSNGDTGYSAGTSTEACSISTPTGNAGVIVKVQVLQDGVAIAGPLQLITDSTGHASWSLGLQLLFPSSGTHQFQVQAMTPGATAIVSTTRTFNFVELG